MRLAALVEKTDIHPASRHSLGSLGQDGSLQDGDAFSWPRVLVIAKRPDGVFLDRFAENGQPAGDTWHSTVEDAKEQAIREYAGLLSAWIQVPETLPDDDIFAFAISKQ